MNQKILSLVTGLCLILCVLMPAAHVKADPPKVGATIRFLYSNLRGDSYENQVSSFDLMHARPYFKGALLDGKFDYSVLLGFDNNASEVKVLDAFGDYKLRDAFSIRFGQGKVPFDRQYLTSLSGMQFIDRAVGGLKAFKRDRGVSIHGAFSHFFVTYDVGVFNGTGITTTYPAKNDDGANKQQHLVSGRITINPQGIYGYKTALPGKTKKLKTSLGFGVATGQISNDSTDVLAYCFDVAACGKGISTMFEYQNKETEIPGIKTTTTGITGQVGYFFMPKLESVGRYSTKEVKNGTKTTQLSFGINCYFETNNAKLQFNFTRKKEESVAGDALADNLIHLLYQFVF